MTVNFQTTWVLLVNQSCRKLQFFHIHPLNIQITSGITEQLRNCNLIETFTCIARISGLKVIKHFKTVYAFHPLQRVCSVWDKNSAKNTTVYLWWL